MSARRSSTATRAPELRSVADAIAAAFPNAADFLRGIAREVEQPAVAAGRLHETFRTYVSAEHAATRAFVGYKFGEVSEAEVHRLQRAQSAAYDAHIEAMSATVREIDA